MLRSSSVMALGTIASRATGMARNLLIVAALGTAIFADTYTVANTIPNIIYILLAGGALNAVFVPQLVRALKEGDEEGSAFASRLLTLVGVALLLVSALAVLAAPLLIRLYATRFASPGLETELSVAVAFARYCLPQIFFYGLYVMLGQIANAKGSFGPMMWSPVLNNFVVIGVMASFIIASPAVDAGSITSGQIAFLGIGTTIGIAVQALTLIPVVYRAGVVLRPRFDWRGKGLGRSGRLAGWTFLFVLVNQLGYIAVVNVATSAAARAKEAGLEIGVGYTPYSNAFLIFLLPHAIITVSIVTALLPRMSRSAANGDQAGVLRDARQGISMVAVAIVPSALALALFAPAITTVLYAALSAEEARQIGWILAAFALGLIPFSAQHLMLRVFYAYEDTRTPVFINVAINAVVVSGALLAAFLLPVRWITVGVAGGYALAYFVGTIVTAAIIRRRFGAVLSADVVQTFVRTFVAGLAALIPAALVGWLFLRIFGTGVTGSALTLITAGPVMLGLYILLVLKMRVSGVTELISTFRARLQK
jgi:putative peptidoglycan lipid II flippase